VNSDPSRCLIAPSLPHAPSDACCNSAQEKVFRRIWTDADDEVQALGGGARRDKKMRRDVRRRENETGPNGDSRGTINRVVQGTGK
jgi:hypothetical protein